MLIVNATFVALLGLTLPQGSTQEPARPPLLSWDDWNADQRLDFVALGANGSFRLFEATADGSFTDVTTATGLGNRAGVQAAVWIDFNSDQLPDLLLVVPSGDSTMLENTGVGFIDVSERSRLALGYGLVAAQALDFDADSRMDLLLSTEFEVGLFRNLGSYFEPVPITLSNGAVSLIPLAPGAESDTTVLVKTEGESSSSERRSLSSRPVVVLAPAGSMITPNSTPNFGVSANPPGSGNYLVAACPPRIEDSSALGSCLQASTVPAFGKLYPLGPEFSIDPATDFVGINDTTPSFRLDIAAGGSSAAARGVSLTGPPTQGYIGVQGTADFDGVLSADWTGLEIGAAGISAGASITDNFGVIGHSNFVGVRGEHATAPASNFGELGLAGVGVHAAGTTAAGEFDGNVNVRDGDGDLAVEIVSTGAGLTNDLRVYRDGVVGLELDNVVAGFQTRWINTGNGLSTLQGGTSASDDGGFWNLRGEDGTILTARIDGDNDVAAGVSQGLFQARSGGTGGTGGLVDIQNNDGASRIQILGGGSTDGGFMTFSNSVGGTMWTIDGEATSGGTIIGTNDTGINTIALDTDSAGAGLVSLGNGVAGTRLALDGDGGDAGGLVTVNATDGSATVTVDGQAENDGGAISVRHDTAGETVRIVGDRVAAGSGSSSGLISLFDRNGTAQTSVVLEAEDDFGTGSQIRLEGTTAGTATIQLDGSDAGVGELVISEADGSIAFRMFGSSLTLHNAAGTATQTYNRLTGTKSAVVPTASYGERVLYTMESPEIWFEDLGSGQLTQGSARVDLDPMFLETVTINAQHPMKVFVSLTGDCSGVWIEKQGDHFVVHELAGGVSNATFDYRVIAKRRGVEELRLDSWNDELAKMSQGADPAASLSNYRPQDGSNAPTEPEIRKRDVRVGESSNPASDEGALNSKEPVRGSAAPFKKGFQPVNDSAEGTQPVRNQR